MIALFSESYNVALTDTGETKTPHATARINRQATLDGGVSFEHLGTCHGDRTFTIRAKVTALEAATVRLMHENETAVYCVTNEGLFSGAISAIKDERGFIDITYLVEDKIE